VCRLRRDLIRDIDRVIHYLKDLAQAICYGRTVACGCTISFPICKSLLEVSEVQATGGSSVLQKSLRLNPSRVASLAIEKPRSEASEPLASFISNFGQCGEIAYMFFVQVHVWVESLCRSALIQKVSCQIVATPHFKNSTERDFQIIRLSMATLYNK
jgi:hypothetical protein